MDLITIKNITFYNVENHFVIFKDNNDNFFQGNLFYPYRGQNLKVKADLIQTTYGEQFKLKTVDYILPDNQTELASFLSSGLFPKIGVKTALKISQEITCEELFTNYTSAISGLSVKKNLQHTLAKYLSLYIAFTKANLKFTERGFNQEQIIAISLLYKENAITILESNPYDFYKKIPKTSFEFLDIVAKFYNLNLHSKERILAGTMACLEDYFEVNKCSGMEFNLLQKEAIKFLQVAEDIYFVTLNHLLNDQDLCEITINDVLLISTPQVYYTELGISNNLKRLNTQSTIKIQNNLATLPKFLSEQQVKTIRSLLCNKVCVLTGMPGSGKTTIINYAISEYKKTNLRGKVYIGTPTGKAAQRVKETNSNLNVSTNHKMLGFLPDGTFVFNKENKLDYDLLILDESSMLDMFMFFNILKALKDDAKLWIIGDTNQLASIGLGDILMDIIDSKVIKHVHLSEVFRQAKGSHILEHAIEVINKQPQFKLVDPSIDDFYCFDKKEDKEISQSTIDLFFSISKKRNLKLEELQILCPQRSSICGIDFLNSEIQSKIHKGKEFIKWKDKSFYIDDKVIQTVNDYDRDVFNGDIGIIKYFDAKNFNLIVVFNNNEVVYEKAEIDQLELAYAISIHKFQGSECKSILMPISRSFMKMLTPKILYTGMTRAKDLLVLNGNLDILNHALEFNEDKIRETFLSYFLTCNNKIMNSSYG